MKQDMNQIINQVRQMNNEELSELLEAIKMQRQFLVRSTVRQLVVGETVRFTGRGRVITGEVIKVNRKNVKVREGFTTWIVPANMLTQVA